MSSNGNGYWKKHERACTVGSRFGYIMVAAQLSDLVTSGVSHILHMAEAGRIYRHLHHLAALMGYPLIKAEVPSAAFCKPMWPLLLAQKKKYRFVGWIAILCT